MSTLDKIKVFGGLAFLAVVGVLLLVGFVSGSGRVTVVAPRGRPLSVAIDGKQPIAIDAGRSARWNLDQGAHEVVISGSGGQTKRHAFTISNGGFDQVLPSMNQCFAVFDATNYLYNRVTLAQRLSRDVVVKSRHPEAQQFDLAAGVYLSEDEVPKEIKSGTPVELLVDVPCAALVQTDELLIKAAGF